MNILLVEDNEKIAELIKKGFKERLHNVDVASDGVWGERWALEKEYDVVILDLVLPGLSGIELCRHIRSVHPDQPVLLLTALTTTQDIVTGFDAGADDYLAKPFHFEELLARVTALWRRSKRITPEMVYRVANLELDLYKKVVRRQGKEIFLSAKEFSLLEYLIVNKNRVLSRSQILESLWGAGTERSSNIVDVYINFLRTKIDKGFQPQLIHTMIGMGYVLKEH